MIKKIISFIIIIVLLLILFAVFSFFSELFLSTEQKSTAVNYKTKKVSMPFGDKAAFSSTSEAGVISLYLLKRFEGYNMGQGKAFCDSDVTWEKIISPEQKVVYVIAGCMTVMLKNGDLRGESGGDESGLFLLEKNNGSWVVAGSDQRERSYLDSGKDWADKNYPLLSDDVKFGANLNHFSTKGIIDQAALYYNVAVPQYRLNYCDSKANCQSNEICVKHGIHSNPGQNTCVRACSANKDCGIAHTCRYQCVNGENGCPYTSKAICVPDLLHFELEKNSDGVIQ